MFKNFKLDNVQSVLNQNANLHLPYGSQHVEILGGKNFERAKDLIEKWPNYKKSPLTALSKLAQQINVAEVYYKDESERFGLSSFKALGGAYAVSRLLIKEINQHYPDVVVTTEDLVSKKYLHITQQMTVSCATDGNHGRSVAWGAQSFGCQCIIYIHSTVSQGRADAIAFYGAQVIRTSGNYDDAVRQADEDAKKHGRFVVSDTSYAGYLDVPKDVMQGYAVMADEVLDQLPKNQKLTHVFLQGGVGGLAAAVTAHLWEKLEQDKPLFIVVEPEQAACLYESAKKGEPVAVQGDLNTVMAGLACGEVSVLAWTILKDAVSHFMTINDQSALEMMRILAKDAAVSPIVAGESAVAGLVGCVAAALDPELRHHFQLNESSKILIIGSEGATDPDLYQSIVGTSAAQLKGAA